MAQPVSAGQLVPGAQAATNMKLVDDYTDPTTNEGNLLSLITLKNILGSQDGNGPVDIALKDMAKEETRHLMLAMRVLTGNDPRAQKLQDKFGRDMNGAIALSKIFKTKADEKEVELLLNPFIMDTIRNKSEERKIRGGFTIAETRAGAVGSDPSGAHAPVAVRNLWGNP